MEEITKKDFYNESDIIEDSELGYVETPAGIIIVEKQSDKSKLVALSKKEMVTCKKGEVYIIEIYALQNGKYKEDKIRIPLKNYLELWKELRPYNIFDLATKDWRIAAQKIKNEDDFEEMILKDYNSIENLREGATEYQFFFRIKDKKHEFQIYDAENLKDKRYLQLKIIIMRFFGWIN